jgi:hypothetical protein
MNIPNPDPLGSLVTQHQGGAADRDAAAVLDPTHTSGAPRSTHWRGCGRAPRCTR